jgi:hypothetical protein
MSGALKTFIDRLYELDKPVRALSGKKLYFLMQGAAPSAETKAQLPFIPKDQVLGEKNVRLGGEVAHPSYRKDAPVTDPYISPVYADLTGLPPMLITAGGDELFLDDAALLAAHGVAAGVPTQFTVYPHMSHDWTLLLPELPASAAMDREIRQFVDAQWMR